MLKKSFWLQEQKFFCLSHLGKMAQTEEFSDKKSMIHPKGI
jgi:hypothetical protein